MDNIIVKIRFKDKNRANIVLNTLLNKRLIAGGTISKVLSKYYDQRKVLMHEDFELSLETKQSKFDKICRTIEMMYNDEEFKAYAINIENENSTFKNYIDRIF